MQSILLLQFKKPFGAILFINEYLYFGKKLESSTLPAELQELELFIRIFDQFYQTIN